MHEHFDADGNRTGHTVVTRESLWDDSSRARAMRLHQYQRSICSCGCGLPYAVSHDKDEVFIVDSKVCYAQRALTRERDKEIEKHKDKDPTWAVGRHHFVYVPSEQEIEDKLRAAGQLREDD